MRTLRHLSAVGLVLGIIAGALLGYGWFRGTERRPGERTIAWLDVGGGYQFRIWTHTEHAYPKTVLLYTVYLDQVEVAPAAFIGVTDREQFDFRTAFADDGRLAGVYDAARPASIRNVVLFDHRTKESWPRPHLPIGSRPAKDPIISFERVDDCLGMLARQNPNVQHLQDLSVIERN